MINQRYQDLKKPPTRAASLTWIEMKPPKFQKDDPSRKRIVQTEIASKVDRPVENAFLGERNQIVDRETVSKNKIISMGKAASASKTTPSLSQLGIGLLKNQAPPKHPDEPNWAVPGTRPQDFVAGIQSGDKTALNTQEYVFYSYFQRIRERLDQAWGPLLRSKIAQYYKSGRHFAHQMEYTTRILVTLDPQGAVTRVQLVEESGTQDLDEAAIGAFNKAGPFPNPPKAMIEGKQEIQIPWDFTLRT